MAGITDKHTTGQGPREGLGPDPLAVPPDPYVHFVALSWYSSIPTSGPGIPFSALSVGFTATSYLSHLPTWFHFVSTMNA